MEKSLNQKRLQAVKEAFEKSEQKGKIVDAIMSSKIIQAEQASSDAEADALIRDAELFLTLLEGK